MRRYAFKLRIKSDAIAEYDREHKQVWPELLSKLREVGISDYSIFRRDQVPDKLPGERFAMMQEVFHLE